MMRFDLDVTDWCENNLGRTVAGRHGDMEGTLSGYSRSDGICWLLVEMPDGSTREFNSDDVALMEM